MHMEVGYELSSIIIITLLILITLFTLDYQIMFFSTWYVIFYLVLGGGGGCCVQSFQESSCSHGNPYHNMEWKHENIAPLSHYSNFNSV